jgi:DNA-binding SARP family transcriptional activator
MHARAELAASFWPDVLDESARASLRTAVHDLRRALHRRDVDALDIGQPLAQPLAEPMATSLLTRRQVSSA